VKNFVNIATGSLRRTLREGGQRSRKEIRGRISDSEAIADRPTPLRFAALVAGKWGLQAVWKGADVHSILAALNLDPGISGESNLRATD
jgi:hypothetical protein